MHRKELHALNLRDHCRERLPARMLRRSEEAQRIGKGRGNAPRRAQIAFSGRSCDRLRRVPQHQRGIGLPDLGGAAICGALGGDFRVGWRAIGGNAREGQGRADPRIITAGFLAMRQQVPGFPVAQGQGQLIAAPFRLTDGARCNTIGRIPVTAQPGRHVLSIKSHSMPHG